MNEIDSIRLLRSLKKITQQPQSNNLIFGEIVSVEPLKIDIGNNIVLTKKFLYLGQMCRPHTVTIPHTHKYSGVTENGTTGITATAPSGPCTITDIGHTHKIKDQTTDDVHKEGCGTDYEKSVTLEIYPKLKVGDKVLMFAFNNNQMYYVAERIEI